MESDTVIYGLLGRIHVLMRRTQNRITDVEYMRVSKDYSREIVRIAESAGNAELTELCARLRTAMELDVPDAEMAFGVAGGRRASGLRPPPAANAEHRYVGSLR